jgi:hypothetical protein
MSTAIANDTHFINDVRAEKNLWVAVLEQAINDSEALARRVKSDPSLWSDPLFRADARNLTNYFKDQSMDFGGFGFICDLLETNPEKTYERIKEQHLRYLMPARDRPTQTNRLLVPQIKS